MNYFSFAFSCNVLLIYLESQVWCTSSTIWIRSPRFTYVQTQHSRAPSIEVSREGRIALCREILDFTMFIVDRTHDGDTQRILEYADLYKNKIFEGDDNALAPVDRVRNRIPCIHEEQFQLHVLFSSLMPTSHYIYIRTPASADPASSTADPTTFKLFALAEPKAVPSFTQNTKDLEMSFLDTINYIITDAHSFIKINYDICAFSVDNHARLCSSAFNAISPDASERKVFTLMKRSLGCWKNPVYFVFERIKNETFVTHNVEFPLVEMLTCEPSSDVKFYVVANLNEHGSVFLLNDLPDNYFEFVKNNDNNDKTFVYVTAHVRSLPVLLDH